MNSPIYPTAKVAIEKAIKRLSEYGKIVKTEKWQGIDAPQSMFELLHLHFKVKCPKNLILSNKQDFPRLNKEWADIHFKERISGFPLNPGESYKKWPFYNQDGKMRNEGEKFSHTYMERFWPKYAGHSKQWAEDKIGEGKFGIRYNYGDLQDVIKLLIKEPLTRQAYLPVWFPEDTGVVHEKRVPCSLGYDFILRDNYLHCTYSMRSCDALRHFSDDLYLAMKLMIQIADCIGCEVGLLEMVVKSFHVFESEKTLIDKIANNG